MNKDEFVRVCTSCGYASASQAKHYAADRNDFDDADIEAVFRYANGHKMGGYNPFGGTKRRAIGLGSEGRTTRHFLSDGGEEDNR